jgi:Asp-tRNA(Asn)/Glu-tRNA(Gln) amidotransferase B subunit
LNTKGLSIDESPVSSDRLGALIDLIKSGTVTSMTLSMIFLNVDTFFKQSTFNFCSFSSIEGRNAKEVLSLMFEGDNRSPNEIIAEKGWTQLPDTIDLEGLCKKILEQNPKEVFLRFSLHIHFEIFVFFQRIKNCCSLPPQQNVIQFELSDNHSFI